MTTLEIQSSRPGDTDNDLLQKILIVFWFASGMPNDSTPISGDTDNNLLRKILTALGGTPQPADTNNNLLRKILNALTGN